MIPGYDRNQVQLFKDKPVKIITRTLKNRPLEQTITFTTSQSNVIGIQILSPISFESTEQIILYDFQRVTDSDTVSKWDLFKDKFVFPTTTSSYSVTLQYKSGALALGDVVIILTAVDRRNMAQAGDLRNFRSKWPMVVLTKTRINDNNIGISTLHYNRYLTENDDFLLRTSNETIRVDRCEIINNVNQAVQTISPFRVHHDNKNMTEFTFMLNNTLISGNARGVEQLSWLV